MMELKYDADASYYQSKLANIYFTRFFAYSIKSSKIDNVKVVSVHPGVVRTELARTMLKDRWILEFFMTYVMAPIFYLVTKTPWYGAQTSLHCCLSPFDKLQNGAYYSDCAIKQETLSKQWLNEAKYLHQWSVVQSMKFKGMQPPPLPRPP